MSHSRPVIFSIRVCLTVLLAWTTAAWTAAAWAAEPPRVLIDAPSGELTGWELWSRDASAGTLRVDAGTPHANRPTLRIDHTSPRDWGISRTPRLAVASGDIYEIATTLRVAGTGEATVGAIAYTANGTAANWFLGGVTLRQSPAWQPVKTKLVVPEGVTTLVPRVTGSGPVVVHVAGYSVRKLGTVGDLMSRDLPALELANPVLSVRVNTRDGTFILTDRRTGTPWTQQAVGPEWLVTRAAFSGADRRTLTLSLLQVASEQTLQATLSLDEKAPELVVELVGTGALPEPLAYPHTVLSPPGSRVVLPMNEGISFPVEELAPAGRRLIAYGGHGLCMAFAGVTAGEAGYMTLLETPDDAAVQLLTPQNRLALSPQWDSQKGQFGPPRKIRYILFDRGGHVAMAKRYRAHAKHIGLLKTLAEKRVANPNVDLLIGAANVWCWENDVPQFAAEMQAAGIGRILWSEAQSPENLRRLNALPGVLTSRYDMFSDLMDPAQFPRLAYTHPCWTTAGWPRDLLIQRDGQWERGWAIETKDGGPMVSCGVLCDSRAVPYVRQRLGEELKTHPYRCRFIDTTTATPFRECYSPEHPMTRSDSRRHKMELLQCVHDEFRQVTGSETGHDAAVPVVDYFEGMLSLGDYRVPDAGRNMQKIWDEVPEAVAKYQLGHAYRLPLWELVYHDCVVAHWYWGDYNNKLPALWDKRDLFNALYGTAPMFMFDRALWEKQKARFVQSYQTTAPVARAVGYAEMLDHRFLTADRSVQQTVFAGGVTVTVNFGPTPYRLPDGRELPPLGRQVSGLPAEVK